MHEAKDMSSALDWNLTTRERQIVDALLRGFANKEIAQHLRVSDQTIKNRLSALYRKVGVRGRVDLVLSVVKRRGAT